MQNKVFHRLHPSLVRCYYYTVIIPVLYSLTIYDSIQNYYPILNTEQSTTASAATPKFYTCNSNSGVEMPTPDLLIDSPTDSGFRFVPNPLRKRTLNPQRDTLTVTVTSM